MAASTTADNAIALIPSEHFHWRARVRFKESFRTRADAVSFAFQHGYNLIVEYDDVYGPQFDVLEDPDGACTVGLSLESVETKDFLVEPETTSWTRLVLSSVHELTRRPTGAVASLYRHEVSPALHRAARRYRRTVIHRAIRNSWRQAVRSYDRWQISACSLSLASKSALSCWDLTRQSALAARGLYLRELAPRARHAASWCWWSGPGVTLRRWWHRNAYGTPGDLARRLAANAGSFYTRKISPRLCHAALVCRQAEIRLTLRHSWRRALLTGIDFAQKFAAAVGRLYIREIAPRLRHAANSYRADIEGAFRRSMEAVEPPRHPSPSHLLIVAREHADRSTAL